MPQLDTLTYFSQWWYLLLCFGAAQMITLGAITQVVAAQKLRQKLNSLADLTAKLDRSDACDPVLAVGFFNPHTHLENTVESLQSSKWQGSVKPGSQWPMSARALQICHTLSFKKRFCAYALVPYRS